ncbi:MAG: 5'-methylthioadenosine/S-adenosylhomocysteine nucleosidase [Selenomonadaceae bacterium]|nr:5'-methylthioadenosine/S-adenosylhomocysteine nucleosidase [Selenomonadaceae bacterium]
MMKKIFSILIAALLMVTSAQAAEYTTTTADNAAEKMGAATEKFYASLPIAKGEYKSSRRPILLEGAMNTETEVFVRALKNPVAYRELNYLFVAGTYKNYPVVVVRTEQGMANAAASTALAIKKFNPVAVINQGTAGGHDGALKIGDIVLGEKIFNCFAIKTPRTALGTGAELTNQEMRGTYAFDETSGTFQPNKEYFPDAKLFNVAKKISDAHKNFNVTSGVICSSDAWLENLDFINFLHETYGSSCEEMETASVAQICKNAGVPFLGIRVISDNAVHSQAYEPAVATIAQDFTLLVVEDYIRVLKG